MQRPEELKFVFIDPDLVEFHKYGNLLNHYLAILPEYPDQASAADRGIVTDAVDAEKVRRSLCLEMDNRFRQLQEAKVCDIIYSQHVYRCLKYVIHLQYEQESSQTD